MTLYPIHQTYGQLLGTIYFSTNNTAKFRNVNILFNLLGILLAFYLIAPKEMFALDLGSTGLALRLLIIQFLITNYYLYFCTKLLKINYWKLFFHQFTIILLLFLIAYLSRYFSEIFSNNNVYSILISSLLYSITVASVAWNFPKLFYFNKTLILNKVRNFYKL